MAFRYGFYNSVDYDRPYDAEDVSQLFDGLITDGVFDSIGDILATVPGNGLQVLVKSGKAWFDHTWSINDTEMPLSIEAPDVTLSRYDAVVLEVDSSVGVRANSIKIVKGTPATSPLKPVMQNTETLHQHPLAYISVRGGATSIQKSDIEIMVGRNECPFVTGLIKSVDITDLFQKWEGDFDTWFSNVQAQLTGNVVTNLQKQIDDRVKIADKASYEDILAGLSDTKWVTPKGLKLYNEAASTVAYRQFYSNGKVLYYNGRRVIPCTISGTAAHSTAILTSEGLYFLGAYVLPNSSDNTYSYGIFELDPDNGTIKSYVELDTATYNSTNTSYLQIDIPGYFDSGDVFVAVIYNRDSTSSYRVHAYFPKINAKISLSNANTKGIFITNNYFGYVYSSTVYYYEKSNPESKKTLTLPNSNYIYMGSYGNITYFMGVRTASSTYYLEAIAYDLSTNGSYVTDTQQITERVGLGNSAFHYVGADFSFVPVCLYNGPAGSTSSVEGIYAKALGINLSTGKFTATVSSLSTVPISSINEIPNQYIGRSGDYAYYISRLDSSYNHFLKTLKMNIRTGSITFMEGSYYSQHGMYPTMTTCLYDFPLDENVGRLYSNCYIKPEEGTAFPVVSDHVLSTVLKTNGSLTAPTFSRTISVLPLNKVPNYFEVISIRDDAIFTGGKNGSIEIPYIVDPNQKGT